MLAFAHVGFRVMSFASGIACRVDARCAAEGFHFQSRIVGKAIHAVVLVDVSGFQAGVSFEGIGGFRNIGVTIDVVQAQYLQFVAEDGAYLFELMRVVGCKNEFLFHCYARCWLQKRVSFSLR